jgi:hypothetical protein
MIALFVGRGGDIGHIALVMAVPIHEVCNVFDRGGEQTHRLLLFTYFLVYSAWVITS